MPALRLQFGGEAEIIVPADEFELAWTPDLLAETELSCEADAPVCMSAELWARHMAESKAPVSSEAMVLFIEIPPQKF